MRSKFLLAFLLFASSEISYAQTPTWVWAKRAGGSSYDYGYCIHTDPGGNIYVAGAFSSGSITFGSNTFNNYGQDDIFVVKYDPSGNVLWARHAGGSSVDDANGITTDLNGNVYVTGYFLSSTITFGSTTLTNAGSSDLFVVKYDSSGNILWAKNTGGSLGEAGSAITADANGNVYVTGYSNSSVFIFGSDTLTGAGSDDIIVLKYSNAGNALWARRTGGSSYDDGLSISADATGNVYATGNFHSASITFGSTTLTNSGADDMFIVKYNTSGTVQWARRAGGTSNDEGYGICTSGGNVFITGTSNSASIKFGSITLPGTGGNDIFIVKYDSNGTVGWAQGAGGTLDDAGTCITADASGYVYLSGFFNSSTMTVSGTTLTNAASGFSDIFIFKYNTSGTLQWAMSAGGSTNDQAFGISAGSGGNVYLTGAFSSSTISFGTTSLNNSSGAPFNDIFVAKLNGISGIEENRLVNQIIIFPNPAHFGMFSISSGDLFIHQADVRIFNSVGEEVYSKEIADLSSLVVNCRLTSGIYFVQVVYSDALENVERRMTQKIIIQ